MQPMGLMEGNAVTLVRLKILSAMKLATSRSGTGTEEIVLINRVNFPISQSFGILYCRK